MDRIWSGSAKIVEPLQQYLARNQQHNSLLLLFIFGRQHTTYVSFRALVNYFRWEYLKDGTVPQCARRAINATGLLVASVHFVKLTISLIFNFFVATFLWNT